MKERIGPYRIEGLLGQGGMGSVFRATDPASGRPLAIKTLRNADVRALAWLRREIEALASLNHPGVVQVLDSGDDEGMPWYAMPLLGGPTLETCLARWLDSRIALAEVSTDKGPDESATYPVDDFARREPFTLEHAPSRRRINPGHMGECVAVFVRLCHILAWFHGEGVVHQDLKPANVIVVPPGHPVVVDFGLVAPFHPGSRTIAQPTGGTPRYMAPEQWRGELVDQRADLYALGCMLYEAFTGEAPFRGAGRDELSDAHRYHGHVPPTRLVPELPPELDALIAGLLEKDRGRRSGHAAQIALDLARIGGLDSERPEAWPEPRTTLYRSDLVGRSESLRALVKPMVDASYSEGSLVLVLGESGAGKTRLIGELAREARRERMNVLVGRGAESAARGAAPEPLHLFAGPVRGLVDRCRVRGRHTTDALLGRRGPILADWFPEIRTLPGQEELPPPVEVQPAVATARLARAMASALCALGEEVPTVLVLDDLHWADPLSLEVLLRARESLARAPLLVVCASRTESLPEALSPWLEDQTPVVRLAGLDVDGVRQVVGGMLAHPAPPPGLVRHLADVTEGNPFFIGEYLYAAADLGLLRRDEAGRWGLGVEDTPRAYATIGLPANLGRLVAARLDLLESGARRLVDVAAVLGREVDRTILAAALGALAETDERDASRRQILEPVGEDRLRFRHDQLREVTVAQLDPDRGRALHASVARALEQARPHPDASPARIAQHWQAADQVGPALSWWLQAATEARLLHRASEAHDHLRSWLELAPDDNPERPSVLGDLARLHIDNLGDIQRGEVVAWQGVAAAQAHRRPAVAARCLIELAGIHRRRGEYVACQELLDRAEGMIDGSAPPSLRAEHTACQAQVQRALGMTREALAGWRTALQLQDDVVLRGGYHLAIANTLTEAGDIEEAEAEHLLALADFRSAGHFHEGMCLFGLATMGIERGRPLDARERAAEALELYRRAEHRAFEQAALMNLGWVDSCRGDQAAARQLLREAAELEAPYHPEVSRFLILNRQAVEIRDGHPAEALAALVDASTDLRADDHAMQIPYLYWQGRAHLALGRPREALDLFDRARSHLDRRPLRENIWRVGVARARVHRELGDVEVARTILDEAEACLRVSDNALGLAEVAAERGLCDPSGAVAWLAEGRRLLEVSGALPGSDAGRRLEALEQQLA